ncbi:hypothetical protein F1559_001223 [Cyanidiococcus yangmingshanensis]|uniref:DNA-directed RNA polymerase I subunit rpa49 n=1 Tax=Cyanidiococcus yangmingshanensis TaxID=2690220 RepID=A0A7J7IDS8_9RHOD|nr:hypothetical protein F1559_001223 [Cyanidiococcus yangmingshanensis]
MSSTSSSSTSWRIRVVRDSKPARGVWAFHGCDEAHCPSGVARWTPNGHSGHLDSLQGRFSGSLKEYKEQGGFGGSGTTPMDSIANLTPTFGQYALLALDEAAREVQLMPIRASVILRADKVTRETSETSVHSAAHCNKRTENLAKGQHSSGASLQQVAAMDQHEARGALVAAFGSKRQKRARSIASASRITTESMQATEAALQQTVVMESSLAGNQPMLLKESTTCHEREDSNQSLANRSTPGFAEAPTESAQLVPAFDAEATTAENAYPLLDGCLPSQFLSMYRASAAEMEDLWKSMKYANRVNLCADAIQGSPVLDDESRNRAESADKSSALLHRCTILYMHILLECYHRWPQRIEAAFENDDGAALSTERSTRPDALRWLPGWLQRLLLERFSQDDPTSTKRIVEKERLLHHILVLYLHAFGFVDQPIDKLAEALHLQPARCATYFKYIGLSVRRERAPRAAASTGAGSSGLIVSLDRLPLQFPPAVRRQRYR